MDMVMVTRRRLFWWKGENKAMVMMRCIISYDGDKNQMTLRNSKKEINSCSI